MSSSAKTDAELTQQLDSSAGGDGLVEAVMRLRSDDPKEIVPSPEQTEALTQKILTRVKEQSGKSEARYNVFKNLGSFVVAAEPEFLRSLISQPEIATAVANRRPQSAFIPPVKKNPVARSKKTSQSASKSKARSSKPQSARAHKSGK